VSQGEDTTVTVRIKNQTLSSAQIDTIQLLFNNGNNNYTVDDSQLITPFQLSGLADTSITFGVNVDSGATTGIDTLDAKIIFTEISSSRVDSTVGAITKDVWTVQQRPDVIIDSVRISQDEAGQGQSGLSGSTASLDSIDLNFLINGVSADTNFVFSRNLTPAIGLNLQAGNSTVFDYDVTVKATALDTTYTIDGYLEFTDINDNTVHFVDSTANKDTLNVNTPANLNITSFVMSPDTVSQGQDSILLKIEVENTGSAPFELRKAQFTFDPLGEFLTFIISDSTLPFIIKGNSNGSGK